ncbi:hypothetical protein EII38_04135 [Streptococcus minor]|uniref:Uncharacterized protein n=1 Tax=Streptococcus minor TaxID=229549 RepID=A0A3P1VCN3_9STRE|nr:hypothetical protein [Streptococcus minor]RRD31949.1 hypothetical protein EII38_04135 [Streptococcus minor]
MKTQGYKHVPFAILFPIFLINWFSSADSNPVWIKHLVYGVTTVLLGLLFFLFTFLRFPAKSETKKVSCQSQQNFHPAYLIPGLAPLPIIAFNILNSSLPTATKAMLILGTFGLIAIIFILACRKQAQKNLNLNKENRHE